MTHPYSAVILSIWGGSYSGRTFAEGLSGILCGFYSERSGKRDVKGAGRALYSKERWHSWAVVTSRDIAEGGNIGAHCRDCGWVLSRCRWQPLRQMTKPKHRFRETSDKLQINFR